MEQTDNIKNALYVLIHHYIGGNKENYTAKTRINFDLGMDGDDAIDFLIAYAEKFQVDLSNFEINAYFNQEGCSPFKSIYTFLFKREVQKPLTIGQLLSAIEAGKLV